MVRCGRRAALLLASASLVVGCGTSSLSARGSKVALVETEPGPGCSPLGPVAATADPLMGGLKPADELVGSARNDARDEAARMGATHIRFDGVVERWPSGTFGGSQGVTVTGMAYRCQAPGTTATAAGGGCLKDTDCKGARICEAARCVDPVRAPVR